MKTMLFFLHTIIHPDQTPLDVSCVIVHTRFAISSSSIVWYFMGKLLGSA